MLQAQLVENFIGGLRPPRFEVRLSLTDTVDRFAMVFVIPGEVRASHFVKRFRCILTFRG